MGLRIHSHSLGPVFGLHRLDLAELIRGVFVEDDGPATIDVREGLPGGPRR